jgi:hypothetical protein
MVRRSPPPDRDKVKIASFRISEGEWFDFSEEADRQNVTATDVIKGAIRNFMAGEFVMPEPIEPTPEPSSIGISADIESLVSTLVNTAIGKLSILGIDRVTEIARNEVDLALSPLSNDLLNLQSQLAEVKADCDLTTEGIQRLIADAISKVSTTTTPAKPSTTKKPLTQGGQSLAQEMEIQKWANRLKANPELKAAIEDGLDQGLTGKGLTEWVFSKGFGANENTKPFDSSVAARMRGAIEYLSGGEHP